MSSHVFSNSVQRLSSEDTVHLTSLGIILSQIWGRGLDLKLANPSFSPSQQLASVSSSSSIVRIDYYYSRRLTKNNQNLSSVNFGRHFLTAKKNDAVIYSFFFKNRVAPLSLCVSARMNVHVEGSASGAGR